MASRSRLRAVLVLGLFALGCGGAEQGGLCERLGQLCIASNVDLRLSIAGSSNASADLDGDGYRDMITASASALSIAWGYTQQRQYLLFPGGVPDVELADVDGDGDLDVLFVTAEPAELRVLINDGTRTLADGKVVALTGRPQSLWVGDLDDDATPDAVVAGAFDGGLTVLTDGLSRVRTIAAGSTLVAVEAGDVDGDGRLDLVAVDRDEEALFVALARGGEYSTPTRIETGPSPEYLQLVDFDGDGALDALTHGGAGPEVWFHVGDGAGKFAAPRPLIAQQGTSEGFAAHRSADGGRWLVMADDGKLIASEFDAADRVVAKVIGSGSAALGVELEDASVVTHATTQGRRWSIAPAHVFTEVWNGQPGSIYPLVLADFDLDGLLDLVTVEPDYDVTLRMGQADGRWDEPVTLAVGPSPLQATSADVTGDGLPDLVLWSGYGDVRVAVGHGDGSFTPGPAVPVDGYVRALHSGFDPHGTGAAAVAIGTDTSTNKGITVLRFDAAGALTDEVKIDVTGNVPAIASADIDKDGRDDLAGIVVDGGDVLLVIHSGVDPEPVRTISLSEAAPDLDLTDSALALGDLDLDGTVDAIVLEEGTILRFHDIGAEGPGQPKFDALTDTFAGYAPEALALVEADGDGLPDVVYCGASGLGVLLGAADGALRPQAPFDRFISSCDLHVDPATLRATAATSTSRGLSVLVPRVAPALASTDYFTGGPRSLARLTPGDVDGDGQTDFVVSDLAPMTDGGGVAVLWGEPGGPPRRATFRADATGVGADVVLPLDDRAGDEVVMLRGDHYIGVLSYIDGSLERLVTGSFNLESVADAAVLPRDGGRADLIVLGRFEEQLHLVSVARDAAGIFAYEPTVLWEGDEGTSAPDMVAADFDADGFTDLAVFPGQGQGMQLLWGEAERVGEPMLLPPDPSLRRLAVADTDDDGIVELIVGTTAGAASIDLRDRRAGTPALLVDGDSFADRLVLADVEGDGVLDVLGGYSTFLTIFRRSQGRVETAELPFDLRPWTGVQAAALDGDDILDLIGLADGHVVMRRSAAGEP